MIFLLRFQVNIDYVLGKTHAGDFLFFWLLFKLIIDIFCTSLQVQVNFVYVDDVVCTNSKLFT